jgi:hypothetical protein
MQLHGCHLLHPLLLMFSGRLQQWRGAALIHLTMLYNSIKFNLALAPSCGRVHPFPKLEFLSPSPCHAPVFLVTLWWVLGGPYTMSRCRWFRGHGVGGVPFCRLRHQDNSLLLSSSRCIILRATLVPLYEATTSTALVCDV